MVAHVAHNTGNNEWYTPNWIIESARQVLGTIDVDPASNAVAQQVVKAGSYYTVENDGLVKNWNGSVWIHPPYSSVLIKQFCNKLKEQVAAGNTESFITLTNNATETKWFKDLADVSNVFCFLTKRVRFISSDGSMGKQPLQGQVLCMRGTDEQILKFREAFKDSGILLSTTCVKHSF